MILLRAPKPDDIGPLTDAVNMPGVRRGTLRLPYTTEDLIQTRLTAPSPDTHHVVAAWDNRAVGLGTLRLGQGRRRHVGVLFLFIHDEHWGRGIGRALLEGLIDLADNWYGLIRLELDVAPSNTRAVKLYESAGFKREGIKRADTICDGLLEDSLVMGRLHPFPKPAKKGQKG